MPRIGEVGVFVDIIGNRGYILVDADRETGNLHFVASVPYDRFLEGDLERAKIEAREFLSRYAAEMELLENYSESEE